MQGGVDIAYRRHPVFRIRRIYDDTLPRDREAVVQVQTILRSQFIGLDERDIAKLPLQLANPIKYRFKSILFVAEGQRGDVKGFALLQHAPDVGFCYLDYISVEAKRPGRGVGGALYDRVREEAATLTETGLFFECLPDDSRLCRNEAELPRAGNGCDFTNGTGPTPLSIPPMRPRSDPMTIVPRIWSSIPWGEMFLSQRQNSAASSKPSLQESTAHHARPAISIW